jgi:hypothetical protein
MIPPYIRRWIYFTSFSWTSGLHRFGRDPAIIAGVPREIFQENQIHPADQAAQGRGSPFRDDVSVRSPRYQDTIKLWH